jgi:hypothetical protein
LTAALVVVFGLAAAVAAGETRGPHAAGAPGEFLPLGVVVAACLGVTLVCNRLWQGE